MIKKFLILFPILLALSIYLGFPKQSYNYIILRGKLGTGNSYRFLINGIIIDLLFCLLSSGLLVFLWITIKKRLIFKTSSRS